MARALDCPAGRRPGLGVDPDCESPSAAAAGRQAAASPPGTDVQTRLSILRVRLAAPPRDVHTDLTRHACRTAQAQQYAATHVQKSHPAGMYLELEGSTSKNLIAEVQEIEASGGVLPSPKPSPRGRSEPKYPAMSSGPAAFGRGREEEEEDFHETHEEEGEEEEEPSVDSHQDRYQPPSPQRPAVVSPPKPPPPPPAPEPEPEEEEEEEEELFDAGEEEGAVDPSAAAVDADDDDWGLEEDEEEA